MQPIKKEIFFTFCVLDMQVKEYESFIPLAHKLQKCKW